MKKVEFLHIGESNNTTCLHICIGFYDGVWHLKDVTDSSNAQRNATAEGSVSLGADGIIGEGLSLSSAGNLAITGYKGIPSISQEL